MTKKIKWILFFGIIIILVFLKTTNRTKTTIIDTHDIIEEINYDSKIITQGLEITDNKLMISSGGYGTSSLIVLDLTEELVVAKKQFDVKYYLEGLTYNGEYIYQLTWKEKTIFVIEPTTLNTIKSITVDNILWGICCTGEYFVISNGSEYLYIYNNDFDFVSKIKVTNNNRSVFYLNELEYYNGFVYANFWKSNDIYKIELSSGRVIENYDCFAIADYQIKNNSNANELNGIAHYKDNLFMITGKNWNSCYIVEF